MLGGAAQFPMHRSAAQGSKAGAAPPETLRGRNLCDPVRRGLAVPGESGPASLRPCLGLLTLRRELGCFANFRPASCSPSCWRLVAEPAWWTSRPDHPARLNGHQTTTTARHHVNARQARGVNTCATATLDRRSRRAFPRARAAEICSVDKAKARNMLCGADWPSRQRIRGGAHAPVGDAPRCICCARRSSSTCG